MGKVMIHRLRISASRRFHRLKGLAVLLGFCLPGCSLGNIHSDSCKDNGECELLFGLGSQCTGGSCSAPSACKSDSDCFKLFGQGKCTDGYCSGNCDQKRNDGVSCYACEPVSKPHYLNACGDSECAPFDKSRLSKLNPDGTLPSLP